MTQKRIVTVDGKCDKRCCNYKHCGGFRNREHRCPEWALNDPMDGETQPTGKRDTVNIIMQRLANHTHKTGA